MTLQPNTFSSFAQKLDMREKTQKKGIMTEQQKCLQRKIFCEQDGFLSWPLIILFCLKKLHQTVPFGLHASAHVFFFFFYICKDAPREGDLPSGTDFPPARQVPFLGVILNIKYFVIKSQLPTKQTLSVVLLCTCVCPDIILWPVWTCCVSISSKPTLNISNFFKISLGICPRRNTTLKCT